MPADEPTLAFEWEIGGLWIDIGEPRRVSYRRGRNRATDKINPGQMTVTMPNESRQYDPSHNALYTLMRPGSRLRITATWLGTTKPLFTGYLERMTQHFGSPESPHDAIAVFEVVDGLATLAAARLQSPWEVAMRALTPRAWFRMGEKKGSIAFDRTGLHHGWLIGSPDYGTQGLMDGDDDTAIRFPDSQAAWMLLFPGTLPTTPSWTISFLHHMEAAPPFSEYLMYVWGQQAGFLILVGSTGRIAFQVINAAGGVTASVSTSSSMCNDNIYLLSVVAQPGQPLKVYNGDVDISSNQIGLSPVIPSSYNVVGLMTDMAWTLDELQTYDYALSSDELQSLEFAAGAWIHDTVNDRVNRVLDAVNWPAAERDLTSEQDDMLSGMYDENALTHLQNIVETTEGRVWVAPDGKLTMRGRNEFLVESAESVATFSDQPGTLRYTRLGPHSLGWELLTNVVTRVNGDDRIVAQDSQSMADYGLRDESDVAIVQSQYLTLEYEYELAAWRLAHYKEPLPYIDGMEVQPRNDPALYWPVVLEMDLGDRVAFARTPQSVGSPLEMEALVEGIKVDIAPKSWKFSYQIDAAYAQRYFLFNETLWDSDDWRFSA